jgi:hypothetical protein
MADICTLAVISKLYNIVVNAKNKILIGGAAFFVIILTGVGIYDRAVCTPEWKIIDKKLEYIQTPNTVKRIELYKAYDYPSTNLVRDTISVLDSSDIESIRMAITTRYKGHWNRPLQEWAVRMKLILDNNETIEIKVAKITNDKLPVMTHLYFGFKQCPDMEPNCSETLASLLEQLTAYEGVNF